MPRSVFNDTFDANNDVKVNSFDWSHAANLTTDTGRITPCFCQLVPAKGSLRIHPRFGLQFMPMNFPIQTRMKARLSFYKYPLRALWKDYRDFVGNFREGLEEPYIDFNTVEKMKSMASTCSLGDYLGLPTTLVGNYGAGSSFDFSHYKVPNGNPLGLYFIDPDKASADRTQPVDLSLIGGGNGNPFDSFDTIKAPSDQEGAVPYPVWALPFESSDPSTIYPTKFSFYIGELTDGRSLAQIQNNWRLLTFGDDGIVLSNFSLKEGEVTSSIDDSVVRISYPDGNKLEYEAISGASLESASRFALIWAGWSNSSKYYAIPTLTGSPENPYGYVFYGGFTNMRFAEALNYSVNDIDLETSPYYNSGSLNKDNQLKISAYAFRAYEGIYNAYFRDNRNNPYYVNGRVEYNKWIPTDEGGADDNVYELHRANWEQDFLTTAVFSPQQGDPSRPPLVGITTYTDTTSNDDGTVTTKEKVAVVDEDGKKFGIEFSSDEDGLTDVSYTELADGQPVKNSRSLFDLATSGIAIETLRNVNAYQKFLELNMRKGYSYRDIIQGRFNVKVRYDELLMPEFLGGFSRDVDVNAVTQSVDQSIGKSDTTYAEALGSQAGVAGVRGGSDNSISVFCDEECIIIGLITVTPLPVYSQLLPKHFLYRGLLDHYQPEFNHLGFQPILYKEVCPVQAYNDKPESLSETFGYQRPWYEYVQKYDTAHGLMRTQLRNFLMNRTFNSKPVLSQSFLLVDPEQVNDVFAVTETTDKIFGQIWFDCTAKLPIARVAIPRLD